MSGSRITCDIDLSMPGKQVGFLRLSYSTHESAYGWIPIPIASIGQGEGPTVLLVSGNHGDEYEGQIALMTLLRTLLPEAVRGRLIVLPSANFPAVIAGRRVSPLDQGNLNRTFPGNPDGSPTEAIAYHIEHELLPMADFVIDLHSGGSSLEYVPSALVCRDAETGEMQRRLDYLRIFGAPMSFVVDSPQGGERTLAGAAARAGIGYLGSELGGGGQVTPRSVEIARSGLERVLQHLGVLIRSGPAGTPTATRIFAVGGAEYFVYAGDSGIFEPCVSVGDEVAAGQEAGRIHFPDTPWREPAVASFARNGTVLCRRVPCHTSRGDCLFHLGSDFAMD